MSRKKLSFWICNCAGAIRKDVIIFFFFIFDEEANTTVPVEADVENDEELEFFFDDKVRKVWHKQEEEWYFSVVDVCQVLTDSADGRKYWNKLKQRLKEEGNESVTNCHQLKMKSHKDGKMYKTDAANTEQLLRIIQSIPSKNAEPFKLWLARVGRERLEEIADPELAFERMIRTYRQKGYSETRKTVLEGGSIAGNARKELEQKLGKSVISPSNATVPLSLNQSVE